MRKRYAIPLLSQTVAIRCPQTRERSSRPQGFPWGHMIGGGELAVGLDQPQVRGNGALHAVQPQRQ